MSSLFFYWLDELISGYINGLLSFNPFYSNSLTISIVSNYNFSSGSFSFFLYLS